jgi:hypothetical protein
MRQWNRCSTLTITGISLINKKYTSVVFYADATLSAGQSRVIRARTSSSLAIPTTPMSRINNDHFANTTLAKSDDTIAVNSCFVAKSLLRRVAKECNFLLKGIVKWQDFH